MNPSIACAGQGRPWARILLLPFLLLQACGAPSDAPPAQTEVVTVKADSEAPCGIYPCWFTAQDILDWQPTDANPFAVSHVRRAPRPLPDGPRVISTIDLGSRAYQAWFDRIPQGGDSGNVYNFSNWPYVASVNYYYHALLAVPPSVWVDAAHRNGVKVLGTMTGDCDGCGVEFNKFFAQANGLKPAQQLHALAETYGFDGWLIDLEAGGTLTDSVRTNLEALRRMKLSSGQAVEVLGYQAFVYELNDQSYPLLQAAGAWESDYAEFSCGRRQAQPQPASSFAFLEQKGQGAQRFASFWNLDLYRFSSGTSCSSGPDTIFNGNPQVAGASGAPCLNSACLFGGQGVGAIAASGESAPSPPYYQSVALFAAQWSAYGGTPDDGKPRPDTDGDRQAFQAADDALWSGFPARPSGPDCTPPEGGNAISAFVTPSTPILPVPFVTRFNEGEGAFFALQGLPAATSGWNLLSTQDVAPTWLCQASSTSSVSAAVSYQRAYDGGSSLVLNGSVEPGEVAEYSLFATHTRLPSNPGLALAYQHVGGTGLSPYLRVTFNDGASARLLGQPSGQGWQQAQVPLTGLGGKVVTRLSVGLLNQGGGTQTAEVAFGELRLLDLDRLQAPAQIQPQTDAQGNLTWTAPSSPSPWYYNVFVQTGDCWQFLGRTALTIYDPSQALFGPVGTASAFSVQPVSTSGVAATLNAPICAAQAVPEAPPAATSPAS